MDTVEILDRAIAHIGEHGFTADSFGGLGDSCCYVGVVNVVAGCRANDISYKPTTCDALRALDAAAGCDNSDVIYLGRAAEKLSVKQANQARRGDADELDEMALATLRRARYIAAPKTEAGNHIAEGETHAGCR